jgi:ribosomal protein L11 methyltransferase
MNWIEVKVTIVSENAALAIELVADCIHSISSRGVVVDDPYLVPDEPWGQDATTPPTKPAVTGYFPVDEHLEAKRQDLEQWLSRLVHEHSIRYQITYTPVDERDWAEAWKAFFWPEAITPTIVVKPTWRKYTPSADQMVIEIDPGMAFGTGTHPTTALCIRLLEKYIQTGHSVLDVGTGSGILLLAAAKLGAARLTGIDLDPMAVEIAGENLRLNGVDPQSISLQCADLVESVSRSHDIVVANILAHVILDLLNDVGRVLKPGGLFICSGIIDAYQTSVIEKMRVSGFDILDIEKEGDWVVICGQVA